ncbi:MAG: zf-TFIIB domain-containing protein [Candidatus Binatia bacterium]
MDTKDHLSAILTEKERAEEDIYFARRDRELIAKLKQQQEAEHEETLRELARSRCPRCGTRLQPRAFHDATVQECPSCQGLWFDKKDIHELAQDKGSEWATQFVQNLAHLLGHPDRVV